MGAKVRSARTTGRRLGAVVATLALAGTFVVGAAGSAGAVVGVSLSQQYGLSDGQIIGVSGSGFAPNEPLNIFQCTNVGPPCTSSVPATADESGSLALTSFTVQETFVDPLPAGTTTDCTTTGCLVVVAGASGNGGVAISFGAAPTTPNVSVLPSTNLLDGQTVDVSGQGFIGYYPTTVTQCRNDGKCAPATPPVFTSATGTFELTFTVHSSFIATDSTSVDCIAPSVCAIWVGQTPTVNAGAFITFQAPGATVTGTVSDEFGSTYSSAGAIACPGTAPVVFDCQGMVFTFSGGAYTLSGLTPNSPYSIVGFAQVAGAFFGAPPVFLTTPGVDETTSGVDFVFDSTLSGTVTGPDGLTPVAGATVNLVQPTGGGLIDTTDAAGRFTSPLIPAGEFLIEVVPPAESGLARTTRPVTIPVNTDVDYGFQLGLGVEIHATMLDGGVGSTSAGFGLCEYPESGPECPRPIFTNTDELGSGVISGIPAGTYNVAGFVTTPTLTVTSNVVVTVSGDDVLTCAFTLNPDSSSCSGTSGDPDGVSDLVEDAAPNGGDGNNDGTPDSDQANVTSLPNAEDGGYVTVAAPDGTTLSNVAASAVPASAPSLPPDTAAPIGLVNFIVQGVTVGGSADVVLHLPPGTAPNSYLKLHDGAWVDFTANTTISGDTITLHLVDGGAGDADGVANGEIVDPGAPGVHVCKKGRWRSLTDDSGGPFASQGDCVSFVATKGKNEAKD